VLKTVSVTDLQHDVAHYLELAEEEDILILKNGKPVGFLHGFTDEDDLFDYQLENDPRFLERVKRARAQFRAGQGIRLEEVKTERLGTEDEQ
jgi:PHD/YefM family antitoxin component YafN of YafNO toxin-antitoxin module